MKGFRQLGSGDIKKLNAQIAQRMANEIEGKVRAFVNMSGGDREKALLKTLEVREAMFEEAAKKLEQALNIIIDIVKTEEDYPLGNAEDKGPLYQKIQVGKNWIENFNPVAPEPNEAPKQKSNLILPG